MVGKLMAFLGLGRKSEVEVFVAAVKSQDGYSHAGLGSAIAWSVSTNRPVTRETLWQQYHKAANVPVGYER